MGKVRLPMRGCELGKSKGRAEKRAEPSCLAHAL